ncbi:MAG: lipase [Planktothrix sp.]|uniref:lipase n=1 Tax=Planktothrix sp. TaxID=3088171 RepID=UPI0038D38CCD
MAIQNISDVEILQKTAIPKKLWEKIRHLDMNFNFSRSNLEQLASYLFQVETWEELRPVFKLPYSPYQDNISKLIEDLQSHSSTQQNLPGVA